MIPTQGGSCFWIIFSNFPLHKIASNVFVPCSVPMTNLNAKKLLTKDKETFPYQYLNEFSGNKGKKELPSLCQHPKFYNSTFAHAPRKEFSLHSFLYVYVFSYTLGNEKNNLLAASDPKIFIFSSIKSGKNSKTCLNDEHEMKIGYEVIWDQTIAVFLLANLQNNETTEWDWSGVNGAENLLRGLALWAWGKQKINGVEMLWDSQ